jgi:hypothetical protein
MLSWDAVPGSDPRSPENFQRVDIRVSTVKQGRSGLGLEAQQAALARFAEVCPDIHRNRKRQARRKSPPGTCGCARSRSKAGHTNHCCQAGSAEPGRSLHLGTDEAPRPLHRCRAGGRYGSFYAPPVRSPGGERAGVNQSPDEGCPSGCESPWRAPGRP